MQSLQTRVAVKAFHNLGVGVRGRIWGQKGGLYLPEVVFSTAFFSRPLGSNADGLFNAQHHEETGVTQHAASECRQQFAQAAHNWSGHQLQP